jgi:hypothetical protein
MWVLPCPFTRGKTASGQVEIIQFYHRISVPRRHIADRQRPGNFGRRPACSRTLRGGHEAINALAHTQVTGRITGQVRICSDNLPANPTISGNGARRGWVDLLRRSGRSRLGGAQTPQMPVGTGISRNDIPGPRPEYGRPKPDDRAGNPGSSKGDREDPTPGEMGYAPRPLTCFRVRAHTRPPLPDCPANAAASRARQRRCW